MGSGYHGGKPFRPGLAVELQLLGENKTPLPRKLLHPRPPSRDREAPNALSPLTVIIQFAARAQQIPVGTGGPWPDLPGLGRSLAGGGQAHRHSVSEVWMWVGAGRPPPTPKLRKLHAGGLQPPPWERSTSRALEDPARAHRYPYLFAYFESSALDVPTSVYKARSCKGLAEQSLSVYLHH